MRKITDRSILEQDKASTRIKALVRKTLEVQFKSLHMRKVANLNHQCKQTTKLEWEGASDHRGSRDRSSNWQAGAENTHFANQGRRGGLGSENPLPKATQYACYSWEETLQHSAQRSHCLTGMMLSQWRLFLFFYFRKSWKSDFNENFLMTKDNCPPLS